MEFKGERWRDLRQLTYRWDAPVVVTTAVQFFETLAARETTALRKLHQVPGSAIFVDEAHAAMPAPLWPQMWKWLRELRGLELSPGSRQWFAGPVLGVG